MKATEIKEMTVEEMNQKLVSLKEELFALRFQLAVNQLENTAKVKAVVVSDKMDKTVVVAIIDNVRHPLYKKIVKRTVRLKAHDENNECRVGDRVSVMETRPLSKDKRWRVVNIIEKAK